MERRHSGRIQIGFRVRVVSEAASLEGEIDDLSENGVSVMLYSSEQPTDFTPGSEISLNFQTDSGETIDLNCRVKWTEKKGLRTHLGMEIINPPWETSASFL